MCRWCVCMCVYIVVLVYSASTDFIYLWFSIPHAPITCLPKESLFYCGCKHISFFLGSQRECFVLAFFQVPILSSFPQLVQLCQWACTSFCVGEAVTKVSPWGCTGARKLNRAGHCHSSIPNGCFQHCIKGCNGRKMNACYHSKNRFGIWATKLYSPWI